MYCPKCGKENLENAQLCSSCSWVLSSVATSPLPDAKTSKAAIWALVLGILAPLTCLLTTLPAIICGIVGLVKINKSCGQLKGNRLAIAGIAIPFIALAILMPALGKVRALAYKEICSINLSGLNIAMMCYANDYKNMYPTSSKWCDLLIEKSGVSPKQFQCKGALHDGRCNYAMNKNIEKLGYKAPADMVVLFESGPGWNQNGGPELLTTDNHKGEGCNVLFVDSHVEFVKIEDIGNLKWTADPNK
jgi:prepilin-type processing-associated H-X9-DG protein